MNRSLTGGFTNVKNFFNKILPVHDRIRITNEVIPEYIPKYKSNYFLFSSKPNDYNQYSFREERNNKKDEDEENEKDLNPVSPFAAIIDIDLFNIGRKVGVAKASKLKEKNLDFIHIYWIRKFYGSTELIKESCLPLFLKNLKLGILDKYLKQIECKNTVKNLVNGTFAKDCITKIVPFKRIKRPRLRELQDLKELKEIKELKIDDFFKKMLSFDLVFLMLMIKEPGLKMNDYQLEPFKINCSTMIDHLSTFLRCYYDFSQLMSSSLHKSDKIVRIDQLHASNFNYDPIECNQMIYAGIKINEETVKLIQEFLNNNFLKNMEMYGSILNFLEYLSKFSLDNVNIDYFLFPIFILLTVFNIIWILYQ